MTIIYKTRELQNVRNLSCLHPYRKVSCAGAGRARRLPGPALCPPHPKSSPDILCPGAFLHRRQRCCGYREAAEGEDGVIKEGSSPQSSPLGAGGSCGVGFSRALPLTHHCPLGRCVLFHLFLLPIEVLLIFICCKQEVKGQQEPAGAAVGVTTGWGSVQGRWGLSYRGRSPGRARPR